jgi:hypothetical protein
MNSRMSLSLESIIAVVQTGECPDSLLIAGLMTRELYGTTLHLDRSYRESVLANLVLDIILAVE